MFEPVLDHRPQGFYGRPVIGLLFVVVTGCLLAGSETWVTIAWVAIGLFWHMGDQAESQTDRLDNGEHCDDGTPLLLMLD
jgi:hypothetical protein